MNYKTDFKLTEMKKLRDFFVELGEDPEELTIGRLFFDWFDYYSNQELESLRSAGKNC